MLRHENIKGIIFDYGGTLDTNGVHWSEVLWENFQKERIPVSKTQFREAYVYAERELAAHPYIKPEHTFMDVLRCKTDIETRYLIEHGFWDVNELTRRASYEHVTLRCYQRVLDVLQRSRPVLQILAAHYPIVLVTNFYGNIQTVLHDFQLTCFNDVIESAAVGVRKPDPQIFRMGVKALRLKPEETLVIGDSYSNDILPAHAIGCQTIWMRGIGWNNEPADDSLPSCIVTDIADVPRKVLNRERSS